MADIILQILSDSSTSADRAKAELAAAASETAQTAAETARTGAETAQTAAETARTGAETARDEAQNAAITINHDVEVWSYTLGTLPATTGVDDTIGAYFKSDGTLQKLKESSNAWTEVGKAISTKDYVDDKTSLLQSEINAFSAGEGKTFESLGTGEGEAMEAPVPADNTPFRVDAGGGSDGNYIYLASEPNGYKFLSPLIKKAPAGLDPADDTDLVTGADVGDYVDPRLKALSGATLIEYSSGIFINGVKMLHAIADSNDRIALYFDEEGTPYFPGGALNHTINQTTYFEQFVKSVNDKNNRVSHIIRSSGEHWFPNGVDTRPPNENDYKYGGIRLAPKDIVCIGDSLTYGTGGESYPSQLTGLQEFASRRVENLGIGGQTSVEIAARVGAIPVFGTTASNEIPASGGVAVTIIDTDFLRFGSALSQKGWFGGVYGTMSRTASAIKDLTAYTFTRAEDGEVVGANSDGQFSWVVDYSEYRDRLHIIWVGRNNPDVDVNTRDIRSIVDSIQSFQKRFVVLSVLNSSSETTGTSELNNILTINDAIEALYPNNYLDVRTILATEADDTVPSSLRADTIHLNDAGYEVVADEIRKFIKSKGWTL